MATYSNVREDLRPAMLDFIARSLAGMEAGVIGVVTIPAPLAPLPAFLAAVPRDMSIVWNNPPSGTACAGGGVAHRIDVAGGDRLVQLREQAAALWARVRVVRHPDAPAYAPRIFGGLAFSPNNSMRWPWVEFGDGSFTLPRWTYGRVGDSGFLSVAIDGPEIEARRCHVLQEYANLIEVLCSRSGYAREPDAAGGLQTPRLRQLPVGEWERHVRRIREAIASGGFRKIVAARRCDVLLPNTVDDIDVLERLMAEPKCTQFAFRRIQTSFLGASPELLFLKSGLDLRTQALAGTTRSVSSEPLSLQGQCERLLASSKDRSEQGFVVNAIRDSIAPLCTEVTVANEPEVLDLPNILHINTPFEARLRPTADATDILAALHPTPAVGGVPGPAARTWIVENEREERGWYTGPVGWLDTRGDAEFAVAIRCGVVGDACAHLYTGAGIVLNSDHLAEYEETALKQLPMLRALGVAPTLAERSEARSDVITPAVDYLTASALATEW